MLASSSNSLVASSAEMIVVPNGSPYESAKIDERINLGVARITENGLPLVYVNQVGGQDELVFDGASFVLNADCKLAAQLPSWEECVRLAVSLGGDADTLGCMAGAVAQARFGGVPGDLDTQARELLPPHLLDIVKDFEARYGCSRAR